MLHLFCRFREVGRVLFARQTLQATGFFLRLLRHFALTTATTAGTRFLAQLLAQRVGHALHAIVFLLLALRHLLQTIQRLVNLLLRLLLLRCLLLHRFVLIALLVDFEREEIGEIFSLLLLTAAPTATAALLLLTTQLHLYVAIQRFRTLQVLQRLLLGRQRITHQILHQLFFRTLHRNDGRIELA